MSVLGGLPAPRPDQGQPSSSAGVAPGTATGTFRGRLVEIFGTGPGSTGVFVYDGVPGLGNPPQVAIVNSSTTTDPFLNPIAQSKILIQSNVITESAGIFRTAGTAPLIQLDGPHDSLLIYDASSNLIITNAPVATSDGLGSAILPGLVSYTTSAPFVAVQILNGAVQFWHAASRGGPYSATGPLIEDLAGSLALLSGTAGGAVQAVLTMTSGATQPASSNAFSGPLVLGNEAAPAPALSNNASILFAASGHLKTVSTTSPGGDGQTYNTERVRQSTAATQQFTLASAAPITGLSRALGLGNYHVRLKVFYVPSGVIGSTHNLALAFSGTATGNVNGQCWQGQGAGVAPTAVELNAGAGNNLTATLGSPTHVANPGWMELDADITVTVVGTLTANITLGVAGDDITTSAGTYWEINPEA